MIKKLYFYIDLINKKTFFLINATPDTKKIYFSIAHFLAKDLIIILFILVTKIFFFNIVNKELKKNIFVIKTFFSIFFSSIMTFFIKLIFYYPRPFVNFNGYQFIEHINNSSNPSNHGFLAFTIAFSFFFWHYRFFGILIMICSISIAWSRIYLGIHWPLDFIGSIFVSILGCFFSNKFFKILNNSKKFLGIRHIIENCYFNKR